MTDAQDRAEYEQYLRETGQHPEQQEKPRSREEMVKAALAPIDNTDYAAAMNNALGAMAGGGLAKAIPAAGGILGSAAEGATLGAAQAPEGQRAKGALTGGALQGGLAGIAALLGKGANALSGFRKQDEINRAVAEGRSGELLKGQAEEAAGRLSGQISQKESELGRALSPEGYSINPDRVAEVFPNYAKKLAEKRSMRVNIPTGTQYADEVVQHGLPLEQVSTVPGAALPETATQFQETLTQGNLGLRQPVPAAPRTAELPKGQLEMFDRPAQMQMPFDELSLQQGQGGSRAVKTPGASQEFPWQEQYGLPLKSPDQVTRTAIPTERSLGVLPTSEQYGLPLQVNVPNPSGSGPVDIGPAQMRRLWKATNKASQFSPSDIMNPAARAKSQEAEALGDIIRNQVYSKTPEAQAIMEKMGQDIQAKNYLRGKAVQKNPQAALSAEKLGTNKMEALMDIDRRVGSDLAQTGRRMAKAKELSRPFEGAHPVESLGRFLERGLYPTGAALSSGASKGGKLAEFLAPIARQAAVGGSRDSGPSAQELSEYEQYLKETGQK